MRVANLYYIWRFERREMFKIEIQINFENVFISWVTLWEVDPVPIFFRGSIDKINFRFRNPIIVWSR